MVRFQFTKITLKTMAIGTDSPLCSWTIEGEHHLPDVNDGHDSAEEWFGMKFSAASFVDAGFFQLTFNLTCPDILDPDYVVEEEPVSVATESQNACGLEKAEPQEEDLRDTLYSYGELRNGFYRIMWIESQEKELVIHGKFDLFMAGTDELLDEDIGEFLEKTYSCGLEFSYKVKVLPSWLEHLCSKDKKMFRQKKTTYESVVPYRLGEVRDGKYVITGVERRERKPKEVLRGGIREGRFLYTKIDKMERGPLYVVSGRAEDTNTSGMLDKIEQDFNSIKEESWWWDDSGLQHFEIALFHLPTWLEPCLSPQAKTSEMHLKEWRAELSASLGLTSSK